MPIISSLQPANIMITHLDRNTAAAGEPSIHDLSDRNTFTVRQPDNMNPLRLFGNSYRTAPCTIPFLSSRPSAHRRSPRRLHRPPNLHRQLPHLLPRRSRLRNPQQLPRHLQARGRSREEHQEARDRGHQEASASRGSGGGEAEGAGGYKELGGGAEGGFVDAGRDNEG